MSQTTPEAAATARAAGQGEDRSSLHAALLEERRGYVQRGRKDRVAQVDEQLDWLEADKEPEPDKKPEPEQAPDVPAPARGSAKAAAVKAAASEPEKS